MKENSAQIQFPEIEYISNDFTLNLYDTWRDQTIYSIVGPVENGIQHNILITLEQDLKYDIVIEYADWQIKAMEEELKGCRLLKRGETHLDNEMPAYEALFSWWPTEELRIYQHQIFVLHKSVGYKMTASFTKKTRKTLGPSVLRMMKSFQPKE